MLVAQDILGDKCSYQLYLSICFCHVYISISHIRINKITIYSVHFQTLGILLAVHFCSFWDQLLHAPAMIERLQKNTIYMFFLYPIKKY